MPSKPYWKRAGKVATDNEAPQWVHRKDKHCIVALYTQKSQRLRLSWKCRGELKMTTDATSVSFDLIFATALTCFFHNKNLRSKYNSASLPYAVSLVTYHAHTSLLTYEGGPKYFRNLNLLHKQDIVQGSATRYAELTIFWTSLPCDIALRALCQFLWHFF